MHDDSESIETLRRAWPSSGGMSDREVAAIATLIRERDRAVREVTTERNLTSLVLAALLAAMTITAAFHAVWFWAQVGYGLMAASNVVAAAVYWTYQRRTRATPDVGLSSHAYYADLLCLYDRQIRLLSTSKYWYALPLLAGVVLIGLGIWVETGAVKTAVLIGVVLPIGAWAAIRRLNDVRLIGDLQKRRRQLLDWLGEIGIEP